MEKQSDQAGGHLKSTITVVTRTERSAVMSFIQRIMRPVKPILVKLPEATPAGSLELDIHKAALKRCHVNHRRVADINVYDLDPKHPAITPRKKDTDAGDAATAAKPTKRIYYFAGGGWSSPPSEQHWKILTELATRLTNTHLTLVSYPLAPHSPAPTAFPQLVTFYHQILADAVAARESVILAGDSAGGNIILALALHCLDQDPDGPTATALLALAPSTDLSRQNPEIAALEKFDPLLRKSFIEDTAKAWRGDWDARDPRVSPLGADVRPLARRGVRVHGLTGGYDILSPDGILFREKCAREGVVGEWLHWEKQMHCFFLTAAYKVKEGQEALDWIVDVLERC